MNKLDWIRQRFIDPKLENDTVATLKRYYKNE